MNYMEDWSQDPILRGDPLMSGIKQENPYEVMKATDFVEKWLESTKEELSIDDLKKELTEFGTQNKTEIKKEIIIESWYICFHCHLIKDSLGKLKKHIKIRHLFSRNRSFKKKHKNKFYEDKVCPHCDYYSKCFGNYVRHLKEVHSLEFIIDSWYICFHCQLVKKSLGKLRKHIKISHLFSRNKYFKKKHKKKFCENKACPHCDYYSRFSGNLLRHLREVHGLAKHQFYSCKHCSFSTKRNEQLKLHIMSKHTGQYLFFCHICEYKALRRNRLIRHMYNKHRMHSSSQIKGIDPKTEQCPLCDFLTPNLKSHIAHHHLKERQFKCSFCNHRSKTSSDLNSHVKSVHKKERLFSCRHCTYSGKRSANLKSHIRNRHKNIKN